MDSMAEERKVANSYVVELKSGAERDRTVDLLNAMRYRVNLNKVASGLDN